jgi:hypothetical protein
MASRLGAHAVAGRARGERGPPPGLEPQHLERLLKRLDEPRAKVWDEHIIGQPKLRFVEHQPAAGTVDTELECSTK